MADNDNKLTFEQVKNTLEEYKKGFEARTVELIKGGKEEASVEVKAVKDEIEKVNKSLDQVQLRITEIGAVSGGGVHEEIEKSGFSIGLLLRGMSREKARIDNPWVGCEKEKEMCEAYEKSLREDTNLIRASSAEDGSEGGYLVPIEQSSEVIDLAIAAVPMLNDLPIRKIPGLRGDLDVPKKTGRPSGFWVGENEKVTASDNAFGLLHGRPKRLASFTKQSQRLLFQTSGVSDTIIKGDLADGMSLTLHQALISGKGSDSQPKGLFLSESDMSSNDVSLGTNGGRFRMTDSALMKMAIEVANEGNANPANYGTLSRPEIKFAMKTERVKQFQGQGPGEGQPVQQDGKMISEKELGEVIGKIATTTQIGATDTVGGSSTNSRVVYGNWDLFWLLMWEGMRLKISDVAGDGGTGSAFLQNQVYILMQQEVDTMMTRAPGFTMVRGAETKATNWS